MSDVKNGKPKNKFHLPITTSLPAAPPLTPEQRQELERHLIAQRGGMAPLAAPEPHSPTKENLLDFANRFPREPEVKKPDAKVIGALRTLDAVSGEAVAVLVSQLRNPDPNISGPAARFIVGAVLAKREDR